MTIYAQTLGQGQNGSGHINGVFADLVGQLNNALTIDRYTTATLPAASTTSGYLVFVSDGNAGAPCLAYSDGTAYHRIAMGAAPNVAS